MKSKLKFNSLVISSGISLIVFFLAWNPLAHIETMNFEWIDKLEYKSLDWRFRMRGERKLESPVVIAAIDEDSLGIIGKWPWPRKIHGKLLDVCRKAGAAAVVFDIVFNEPDRYEPENDRLFGQAIKRYGKTVMAMNFRLNQEQVAETDDQGNLVKNLESAVIKEDPIPQAYFAQGIGFVNAWPDSDGYLRKATLSHEYDGKIYYALNVQAVAVAKGISPEKVIEYAPTSEVDRDGYLTKEAFINWQYSRYSSNDADEKRIPFYSCSKILDEDVPMEWKTEWLKGKVVLVGSTALGLYDHYPTALESSTPGLYMHANVIENLWDRMWANRFLEPVTKKLSYFLIFIFAIAVGAIISNFSATLGAISTVGLAAMFWMFGYYFMIHKLYYIELVAPTASLVGSYLTVFFYRFIVEQKEKAGIKKAFGVYVNPHVVEAIAKNPEALKLGGEMREMTVMFSDVAGFTTISEKLSPEELVQLLNLYLTAMTDTIMKLDGTVDKYEGDAIMAFWGAPLAQPRHAQLACQAVLENRERLRELNVDLEKKGLQQLFARCGLNTGPMNVGNMGSSQKFNYTVMGDSVNLASRLEGANKQYGTMLMVSESTYAAAKDDIEVRELDILRVKGKNLPIKVYELVCGKGQLTDAHKKAFEIYSEGLELYRKRQFKKALLKFEQVCEILNDDGPAKTYMNRSKEYIKSPPPENWDGVFVMTTK
ncbi:MAG: hypothetical protein A2901_01505 [Elusimicrobia bacterium RIFCSPLOWO2_01_FULL_54_10]|nr:MAG: hypothetical protein A2901_01505 [Elusimicrobia bacterium RIFCSPLOWO2_01_FULL_54_10]